MKYSFSLLTGFLIIALFSNCQPETFHPHDTVYPSRYILSDEVSHSSPQFFIIQADNTLTPVDGSPGFHEQVQLFTDENWPFIFETWILQEIELVDHITAFLRFPEGEETDSLISEVSIADWTNEEKTTFTLYSDFSVSFDLVYDTDNQRFTHCLLTTFHSVEISPFNNDGYSALDTNFDMNICNAEDEQSAALMDQPNAVAGDTICLLRTTLFYDLE